MEEINNYPNLVEVIHQQIERLNSELSLINDKILMHQREYSEVYARLELFRKCLDDGQVKAEAIFKESK